jgi:hypothetical protein
MKKNLALILTLHLMGCGSTKMVATDNTATQPTLVKTSEEIAKDFAESLRDAQDYGSKQMNEARKQVQGYADTQNKQTDGLYGGLAELAKERQKVLNAYVESIEQLRAKLEVYQKKGD